MLILAFEYTMGILIMNLPFIAEAAMERTMER